MNRAAALVLGLAACACAPAAVQVSAWTVDWRDEYVAATLRALDGSAPGLAGIDEFRLQLLADGSLAGAAPPAGRALLIDQRARTLSLRRQVTLVNDVVDATGAPLRRKDAEVVHALLGDPARVAALVAAIRAALAAGSYDGLDLDFENLHAADRAALTAFVAQLAGALHGDGRRLTVTVQPQTKAESRDGPGAQDLAALGQQADELRVMAYHVHHDGTEPGPSAPWRWLGEVLAYTRAQAPGAQLTVALYAGGWQWLGEHATQVSHAEALATARRLGAAVQWSPTERAPYFVATSDAGAITVWFENACSLLEKSRLAAQAGVHAVALWHLGNGDPAAASSLAAGRCPP